MKRVRTAFFVVALLVAAIAPASAQQSRTGPVPPPGTDRGLIEPTRAQVLISGVPTYIWHHGCGPTAVGMVVGYWDGLGASQLVDGDASTQTAAANTMMTNDDGNGSCGGMDSNHFQDYSCPKDYSPSPLQTDRSETGGAHTDDCVGDFMYTSHSYRSNYYGWSWFSHVPRSFTEYVDLVAPGSNPQATNHYYGTGLWAEYVAEIDANRPVVLLVDTDGDEYTDHFVTGIGYNDVTMQYAIYDTWDHSTHWYNWHGLLSGSPWGIYGITKFSVEYGLEIESSLPYQNQIDVSTVTDISVVFNLDVDLATLIDANFMVYGSLTGLHPGTLSYDSPSRTATFDPTDDFSAGELVTVTLTTGLESAALGYPLMTNHLWSFTTSTSGGGVFVHERSLVTANDPRELCAADFNGDGIIDLAVVCDLNVSILMGQGDGSFAAAADHVIDPMYGFGLAPGDLDQDGDIDLAVSVESSEYMPFIFTLLNNGDGTFVSSMLYPVSSASGMPIIIDLDGDGAPDMAKVNTWNHQTGVFINNGDGTFAAEEIYPVATAPYALCAGDIESDYDFDLAVAAVQSDDISTLANNGDGTFGTAVSHANAWNGYDICAADFNGDGHIDLANASEDGEYMGYIHTLLNDGEGGFSRDGVLYIGGSAMSVAAGDLDGDGDIDLTTGSESDQVYILTNYGDGVFSKPIVFPSGTYPHPIILADFNNDGTLDMAKSVGGIDGVKIYLNYTYLCGDANRDYSLNVGDAVYIINYVFKGGPTPEPLESGDANCDDAVNVGDAVYMINFVFKDGPAPCCPE
ncbi:MAG: hypothetical protein GY841_18445 [FCB group bacterium]|nr:hypothetical protein [FCB group bacterium]